MILYHFTALTNVEAIQRDGLQAALTEDSRSMVGFSPPVVFLCNTPTCDMTDAEVTILRQRFPDDPLVNKRWIGTHTVEPLARFTVRLPSSDRKLKQYGRWLRGNGHRFNDFTDGRPDASDPLLQRAFKTWWVYFGDIAPSNIVECITQPATALALIEVAP